MGHEPLARRHPLRHRGGSLGEAQVARRQQAGDAARLVDHDQGADTRAPHRYGSPFYRNYYNYNYYGLGGGGYYGGSVGGGGRPRGNAQPGDPDSRGGDGVVVNGRGYTRVRPAGSSNTSGGGESATPTSRSSGSTRGVRSVGSSDSSSSSSSSSSSGSSSSGSSSGGYSSGGGGGSDSGGGGRTAQPR
jgi:hypothetical protein